MDGCKRVDLWDKDFACALVITRKNSWKVTFLSEDNNSRQAHLSDSINFFSWTWYNFHISWWIKLCWLSLLLLKTFSLWMIISLTFRSKTKWFTNKRSNASASELWLALLLVLILLLSPSDVSCRLTHNMWLKLYWVFFNVHWTLKHVAQV